MDPSNSAGRSSRQYAALALILLVLHAGLLLAAPNQPVSSLLSNLIEVAIAALTAVAAWVAASRSEGFAKRFWRLLCAAVVIWVAAQSLATFYDSVLHKPTNEPWPSDILFFIWAAPAFLILLLNPNKDPDKRDWQQFLDFAQVGILVSAAYLFLFAVPAHWRNRNIPIGELVLIAESGRDALLIFAFLFRAAATRSVQQRSLYGRMALFFLAYAAGNFSYLYLQFSAGLRSGTLWDLCWSFPFALGTVLIATPPRLVLKEPKHAPEYQQTGSRGTGDLLKVVPLVFPLVVLLMAAHIAEQQFAIAVAAVLASFSCSSASLILGERQQLRFARVVEARNALLKSIFEGTGDAIYVKDAEGRYLIVNDTVARFFGKTNEQIIGKTAEQLTDSATARELTKEDRSILETGKSVTVEFHLPDKNDTRSFLVTRSPYRDASGKIIGIIGLSRDITEHRLMEDRLRQAQKMEAIGTLAGGVAHDFNNILMVISGYSSVLNDALAGDPKLRPHVEQIQKAGERAASLTRQLLAFSRKQAIQPVPLNLNTVVSGIEKLLHRLIGENITIFANLNSELGTVLADAGQIEQVILNLAINARDAMPEGGRLILETRNTEIQDAAAAPDNLKPGAYVELIVSDTGIGMELGVQARIFEPFFTTKPLGKGTGLGLSTVYGIVQQANGHVTFTSQPGAGTTFRVYLPRIDRAQAAGDLPDESGSVLDGTEAVLLVEDDPSVCELVRAVLSSHGYTVLSARHPQEAEMLCNEHGSCIDLLLSDVIMPEMNGGELSWRLRQKNPQLKVLFMSGYIDESVVRQGIREKNVAYLQKPFSPISLAKKVREVLDGLRVR